MIDLSVNIEDDFAKKQNEKVVHQAVASMDEPDRSIFILRFFYSNTVKDIANKLALKPKQVENSLFRKKESLKEALIEGGISND